MSHTLSRTMSIWCATRFATRDRCAGVSETRSRVSGRRAWGRGQDTGDRIHPMVLGNLRQQSSSNVRVVVAPPGCVLYFIEIA